MAPLHLPVAGTDHMVFPARRRFAAFGQDHWLTEYCHERERQCSCYDTAFHKDMPWDARLLPIPRRYESTAVRR